MTVFAPITRRMLQQSCPTSLSSNRVLALNGIRPFSQRSARLARKDTMDKDSLKPEPNEYSKSGSDDAAARVDNTAFDPDQTRPEEQHASAGKESQEVQYSTLRFKLLQIL